MPNQLTDQVPHDDNDDCRNNPGNIHVSFLFGSVGFKSILSFIIAR